MAGGAGGGPPCKSKNTTFEIFKKRQLLLIYCSTNGGIGGSGDSRKISKIFKKNLKLSKKVSNFFFSDLISVADGIGAVMVKLR